ncbi:ribose-phosphate pyrophosphokinase [Candidatus Aerophobetes bacterium]|uniref:Ribose-phosphate pyrophosphokinase n=1 Tax=Aerophobetes bacterium TaxID=2030807 RepID=A0A662DKS0_UNCAE|nr:MAG: ribose-phosphate pyrophosphokinase [Candidatus Aerophobetes bacterium]
MELNEELKVFTGRANPQLAQRITEYLGIKLGDMEISSFSDGETYVKINENIRGRDVFLIQPTHPPVNENLMELLIMIDACLRASAKRITAVVPYYGYARQDRKDRPRVPITAKLVANLITTAGADRILTLDLHVDQIQGFFDIKVDHLFAAPVIVDYFRKKELDNLVVLSPDVGGLRRARTYAKVLRVPLAIVDKRRPIANEAEVIHIVGEVRGRQVLIIDDIVDTGGTLLAAVDILLKNGADTIYAACTHPVLSGDAFEKLKASPLKEIVVTDTIPLNLKGDEDKVKVLSVAPLLGEAIKRIHQNRSVSSLFNI